MKIIDMHCDTIWMCWENPCRDFAEGENSVNLKLMEENGSLAQFFALYLPREAMETMDSYDILMSMYACYRKVIEENRHRIRPALCAEDVLRNSREGFLSSILTIEDGVFLDGRIERVTQAYEMGVRLITLLWNFENSLGYPSDEDAARHGRGLKPFGVEVVEEMNRLGMIVDVSHLSEGGFYDVARHSKKPFVASHSCARALCNHRRNLSDDQLKTLGNSGGLAGINFERSFLKEGSDKATFDQIIAHLLYMKDKAGIEAVGFGSDFDGIEDNGELIDYSGFTPLLARMEKHFTDAEIEKISWQNALRVLGDVTGR